MSRGLGARSRPAARKPRGQGPARRASGRPPETPPSLARPAVTLEDRYTASEGAVLISGIQALVRVALEQRRLDVARNLDTAAFISGYQGSPLGGLDRELQSAHRHLEPLGVTFRPGLNEELAATAVAGTQLLGTLERRRVEAVTGYWFGKSPGLDRAADAIRHANISGTAPLGGAVAWIGDDPSSKSSTVPSASEATCRSLMVPLLAPGSVAEILSLGLHAVAISREAGLWTGLKVVADIADATAVVELDSIIDGLPAPVIREATAPPVLLPPTNLDAEDDLMTLRLERARDYARRANLNRVTFEPRRPRLALMAPGTAYQALVRALADLGLGNEVLETLGIRLVQIAMPWPLDAERTRALLGGVETVFVIEDKLPFVESQVKELLYGSRVTPQVIGKHDQAGLPLLSPRSSLSADDIARALGRVLADTELPESARRRIELLEAAPATNKAALPTRAPYFCSGCPHNVSTRARPEELVGAGIGCHTMIAIDSGNRRGTIVGMSQMGGEGAQWIGLEPYTEDEHFIQNLGDGTFHHSGSLAIRAAVAAGSRMTYRLLYNDAVAMTGGQRPEGRMDVPSLTRLLAVEGVQRIIITTPEPDTYRGIAIDPIASVRHRDELQQAQRELAALEGVTVLIHDDRCATEKRRLRKRGKLPVPAEHVWINERVCEGCGDCGEKSTCLSVQPVETEFGRKTRIHQSSCNQDLTCLKGDCPAFSIVQVPAAGPSAAASPPRTLPRTPQPPQPAEPRRRVSRPVLIRMPGIGGTGVVTVSQILQMAAHLDGLYAAGVEQTGLAQKGGPVLSDIRISDSPITGALRAGAAKADVLIGFDLLGAAAAETLRVLDPTRTLAVLNTAIAPTAEMITDPRVMTPNAKLALRRIAAASDGEPLCLEATKLAEGLFGESMPANMLLVGAAFQDGCLPLSAAAIERAIELNGASVEQNLAAFRWGRAAVADPESLPGMSPQAGEGPPPGRRDAYSSRTAQSILEQTGAEGELRRLLEIRVGELIAYQSPAYARGYAEEVHRVAELERERTGGASDGSVAEAYARGLYKLMAYKDEYEVARLHLDAAEQARRDSELGEGARVRILLHPPLLRALGLGHKLALGATAQPLLKALHRMRRLRGTPLDPFGRARMRRLERELIGEYRELVERSLDHLEAGTVAQVAEIAALPDIVRGYEAIKLGNVERFRERAAELSDRLERGSQPLVS